MPCGPSLIVVVDEVLVTALAFGFRGVGPGVGPFLQEDAVEAFDFAVSLGPVGPGAFVADPGADEDVAEGPGAVAGAVVGHHPLDRHPVGGEGGDGVGHEGRGGGLGFIGQDLGVDEAGVVIDGVVDGGVAPDLAAVGAVALGEVPCPGVRFAAHPAQNPVAAAVRDPAELLDVDVDHLSGPGVLVPSGRLASADPGPGGRVREPQRRAMVSGQDAVDRGDVQVQVVGDPGRASALLDAQAQHPAFGPQPGSVRAGHGPAAAVRQPCYPRFAVATGRARRRLNGDVEPFGRAPKRPAVLNDATGQAKTPGMGQNRVRVGHEDLLVRVFALDKHHTTPEVLFTASNPSACHQPPGSIQLAVPF